MTFVDRMKRNLLISTGLITCAVVMAVEAALQSFYLGTTNRGGLIACAFMIILFQTVFSLFLDGPTYFYIAEIWPSHVRSQGFAIAMATLSLTNLMWLQSAPHAFESAGWKFYLCFILIPAFGGVIIFFFYHDTLRVPLEEIAAMFGDADEVVVYQQQLDTAKIPLDVLESDLPGQALSISSKNATAQEIEHKA